MDQHDLMGHTINIAWFNVEINDLNKFMALIKGIKDRGVSQGHEGCTIQLLNAQGIAGEKHLLQATLQALKAFDKNENMAKDLGLEICVRASAQRQISRALKILGVKEGKNEICVVAVDCDRDVLNRIEEVLGTRHDETLSADENALKKLYKISNEEIKSVGGVERVLIERTALLNLEI